MESSGIKTTGGEPKDILIWNSSVKWRNIDREFQHVAHNSEMQLFESPAAGGFTTDQTGRLTDSEW